MGVDVDLQKRSYFFEELLYSGVCKLLSIGHTLVILYHYGSIARWLFYTGRQQSLVTRLSKFGGPVCLLEFGGLIRLLEFGGLRNPENLV